MFNARSTFSLIIKLVIILIVGNACLCLANELSNQSSANISPQNISDFGRPATRIYTDKDGLPHTAIMCMEFDKKGYLWVGTQDGAAYYNGNHWDVVNLPNRATSNFVRAILVSADGSICFGTLGGGVLRLKDGNWTVYEKTPGQLPVY